MPQQEVRWRGELRTSGSCEWERPTRSNRHGPIALDQRELRAGRGVSRRLFDRRGVLDAGRAEVPHMQPNARGGRPFGRRLALPAARTHNAPARFRVGHTPLPSPAPEQAPGQTPRSVDCTGPQRVTGRRDSWRRRIESRRIAHPDGLYFTTSATLAGGHGPTRSPDPRAEGATRGSSGRGPSRS